MKKLLIFVCTLVLFNFLKESRATIKEKDSLQSAISAGDLETVKSLIEKGVTIEDPLGHAMISLKEHYGDKYTYIEDDEKSERIMDIIEYLVSKDYRKLYHLVGWGKSKRREEDFSWGYFRDSILNGAIVYFSERLKKIIVNILDEDGNTLLHRCQYPIPCMKQVIKAGANLEAINDEGLTPFQVARKEKNKEAMQALLDAGAKELSVPKKALVLNNNLNRNLLTALDKSIKQLWEKELCKLCPL